MCHKLLCKLGLHAWFYWTEPEYPQKRRACWICDKAQALMYDMLTFEWVDYGKPLWRSDP